MHAGNRIGFVSSQKCVDKGTHSVESFTENHIE
jgi:hypothetical protein